MGKGIYEWSKKKMKVEKDGESSRIDGAVALSSLPTQALVSLGSWNADLDTIRGYIGWTQFPPTRLDPSSLTAHRTWPVPIWCFKRR